MNDQAVQLTVLLERAASGDGQARDELFAQIYPTLRRLAHRELHANRHATLSTTMLVNEASMRLFGADKLGRLDGRGHLFATAARAMRHVLVDYARQRQAEKRGGDWQQVAFDEGRLAAAQIGEQVLALDDALRRLQAVDARSHEVVELRFFGGCTLGEIAAHLGVSEMTVKRSWRKSRAFLHAELAQP